MWDYINTELLFDACIRCVVFDLFNLVKSYNLAFLLFIIIPTVIFLWFLRACFYTVYDEKRNTSTNRNWIKILSSHSTSFFNKRFLFLLLPLLFTFFVFLAEAHDKRIDRASNAFAQAESFLREQYPNKEEINARKNEPYYGSAIELRKSLNFLHQNNRQFTFLYLPKAELGLVELSGAALRDSNFSHTYLSRAKFNTANLLRANFSSANLYKTKFNKAELTNADFEKADLNKAEFKKANMKEAKLTGAVITATDFTDAKNLKKEQIEKTCWLRPGIYIMGGKEIEIKKKDGAPPILPKHIKIDVHSLPSAKLADKRGEIAYCP